MIKDIDIIASSEHPQDIMDAFCKFPEAMKVINHGETKSSVLLEGGIQCDLRIVEDHQYPYALHHFTGSKEHNVAMRQRAISRKMKMSEWGLFRIKNKKEVLIPCKDETGLFEKLGLSYIPPELRENLGEIEAAESGTLPTLLEYKQIKGCLHNHTEASDGKNTLAEMAEAAHKLGWQYLGIADHSKSSAQANGLSEERLLKQIRAIAQYNKKGKCRLFAGVECDILKDGSLDFPDSLLKKLDYVVAAVHSSFKQSEKEMTQRILKAIKNPYVTVLAHPTGRLLLRREPYEVNLNKIIDAAAETGTWIELNANPYRLDLDWRYWKQARDRGVLCAINPDAHHTSQLQFVEIGVQIARKGWLRKQDVVNTLPLASFEKALLKKRSGYKE